jgi:hypothetical protein
MKIKRLIFTILLGAAFAASATPIENPDVQNKSAEIDKKTSTMGHLPVEERGPSFSSPQELMHPNGDRVGHYPPYYRPDPSGGPNH